MRQLPRRDREQPPSHIEDMIETPENVCAQKARTGDPREFRQLFRIQPEIAGIELNRLTEDHEGFPRPEARRRSRVEKPKIAVDLHEKVSILLIRV